jgi:hypothetical protein
MKIHDLNDLRQFYYVGMRRVEMKKDDLMKSINIIPKFVTEEKGIVSFFCDILYPIIEDEIYIRLYVDDIDQYIDVKLDSIIKIHLAGWPRAGRMAEMFTDFPWRLLKPVYQYLKQIDKPEVLFKNLYNEMVYDNMPITKRYLEELLTHAVKGLDMVYLSYTFYEWVSKLKDIYESIITTHKQIMLKAFSQSEQAYPYLGVIVNKSHLLTDTHNPFIQYLDECIQNQAKILGKI